MPDTRNEGKIPPTARRMTRADVAALAGVANSTVSYVLSGTKYVSPETKEKVLQAIRELGYRPNLLARSLTVRRTNQIGLVVPNIQNPYFSGIAAGVAEAAAELGCTVSLAVADEGNVREVLTAFNDRMVDAVVLDVGEHVPGQEEIIRTLQMPVVTCDYRIREVPWVIPDLRSGAEDGVRCLYSLGHRRIGLLAGYESRDDLRLESWCDTLGELGLTPVHIAHGNYKYESGARLAPEFVGKGATAVLVANDFMAVGFMDAVMDMDLSIPGDISVMGFDDIWLARHTRPKLSSVRTSPEAVGRRAAEMALGMIHSGSGVAGITTPTELVVRQSISGPRD